MALDSNTTYEEQTKKKIASLGNTLTSSKTAYAKNTLPTAADLKIQSQMKALQSSLASSKSDAIRNKWYGATSATTDPIGNQIEEGGSGKGWLVGGLEALQKPLNAIAGNVNYALGHGSGSGYFDSINNALKEGTTFGDVLTKSGLPNEGIGQKLITAPLGFALDVALDPVNWLTAGTEALIPRVGMGLVKGGAKGAGVEGALKASAEGLTSGLARKASKVANIVPFAKNFEGYKNMATKLGEAAISGAEKYDTLIGKPAVSEQLGKGILGFGDLNKGSTFGSFVESAVRDVKPINLLGKMTPSGDEIADFFKYSPVQALEAVKLKDKVETIAKRAGIVLTRTPVFKEGGEVVAKDVIEDIRNLDQDALKNKINQTAKSITQQADEAVKSSSPAALVPSEVKKVTDSFENAQQLLRIAGEDYSLKNLEDAYRVVEPGKTGVKFYDDMIDSARKLSLGDVMDKAHTGELAKSMGVYDTVKDWKPLGTTLEFLDRALALFKTFKVPASVSSFVYAIAGNGTMLAMAGGPVQDQRLLKYVYDFGKYLRGSNSLTFTREMFFDDLDKWWVTLENNPNLFRSVFGFSPETVKGKVQIERALFKQFGKPQNAKTWGEEMALYFKRAAQTEEEILTEVPKAQKLLGEVKPAQLEEGLKKVQKLDLPKTGIQTFEDLKKSGFPIRQSDLGTSMGSQEFVGRNNWFDNFKLKVAKNAASTSGGLNVTDKVANLILNKMPNWYESIDQSFKLGTAKHLTAVGWPLENIKALSRIVPIGPDDFTEVVEGGQKLYRLTPQKAAEAVTEIFMNYSAMPDFVKVLRSLPIVGSPFLSFTYAMGAKTGKTLINNPAIFNKIAFLMQEISGARTPEEKKALTSKYNEYLDSPTVMKLAGMWNTDVKNMLPYLTMNTFMPSERKYSGTLPSEMLKLIDNSPLMKHPIGQVMFDYFVQPWFLSGQQPQGQFGQPLYPAFDPVTKKPVDVGLGTKSLYALRSVGEAMVPGIASYAGLANAIVGAGPEKVDWIPAYGVRQIANATQGRNVVGSDTKEPTWQKAWRAVLARSGLPLYPLDTTKTSTK